LRNKELIIIAGPTGIGKTSLGIRIAKRLGTEIVSADSRQLYREMTIGTAVPSPAQLAEVKHHFIQVKSITEYYSAGRYESEALGCLKYLFATHDKVVLLGGTGLYIDAVRNGIDYFPDADLELREALEKRFLEEGFESLKEELKELDPVSYSRIDLNNPKRVQKALEVTILTGKPYSGFLNRQLSPRFFSTRLIALNMDRAGLYDRINSRVDEMMKSGWLEEARELLKFRNFNALNTVGYKDLFAYFDGLYSLGEAVERIKANTRKYARKQITWFRKDPAYRWFHPANEEKILNFILNESNDTSI
jgi:tRNA dimethylallyltransferase